MALIQCSECKREISDQAQACPNCGAPRTITGEGGQQPPSVRAGGVRRVVLLVFLVLLVLAAYRVLRPALEKAGVVASARFAIDSAGGDDGCTVLGDYCMRVRCAVINIGEANGLARVAVDLIEDGKVIATHLATTPLLAPGQRDTVTLDFPEATMASRQHQYRCYAAQ
jgi:hypothetical protein